MKNIGFARLTLIIVCCIFVFSGCSHNEETAEKVSMPDASVENPNKPNEVKIVESDLNKINFAVETSEEQKTEKSRLLDDNSEVSTMYDGYGNKTETRYFSSDPRLSSMTIKTFANGRRTALIFGQNGERKALPPDVIRTALALSPEVLADKAGIVLTRSDREARIAAKQRQMAVPTPNPVVQPPPADQIPEPEKRTEETPAGETPREEPNTQPVLKR